MYNDLVCVGRIFNGIGDQICDNLTYPFPIGMDNSCFLQIFDDGMFFGCPLKIFCQLFNKQVKIKITVVKLELARVDLSDIQQITDKACESVELSIHS